MAKGLTVSLTNEQHAMVTVWCKTRRQSHAAFMREVLADFAKDHGHEWPPSGPRGWQAMKSENAMLRARIDELEGNSSTPPQDGI